MRPIVNVLEEDRATDMDNMHNKSSAVAAMSGRAIAVGQKVGVGCCAPFRGYIGLRLGLHLTQCHLGRGLPQYQVTP